MEQPYAFENVHHVQRDRLHALEGLLDPGTIEQLERRGVGPGWRCLEVGAGGGSIAAWLCARVAREGSVLATDVDTTVVRELSHPNLEVRIHDVLVDELPADEFDLVHLRLVLAWLARPRLALQRLVASLKPGGWLVAEEMDFVSLMPAPQLEPGATTLFTRLVQAHHAVLTERHGFDVAFGRRLVGELADVGLTDVGSDGRVSIWRGGEAGGTLWGLTLAQLREPMIASGLVTPAEVDDAVALCQNPRLCFQSPITMAAWGRRPATS